MPLHTAVGSDVASLKTLLEEVDQSGEKFTGQPFLAGDSWAVVTETPRPRKPQTR